MKNYCYTCMNELQDGNLCHHCLRENVADDVVYRLKPGTILNRKYLVGNCIGEGGFGITYIGRDLTLDMRVAIKEYYPNGYVNRNHTVNQLVTASTESQRDVFEKGRVSFLEEARKIAKFVGEPGIVGVREYFEENGTAYIIMDYLDGVNLSTYIKRNGTFRAEQIFQLMLPIIRSLKRIHESGIIHRDISPDNIMFLRNGTLKLMDFGSARYFTSGQKEMSVLLKQGYAPEEQYRKNGDQGPWTDVYGLCATIYRCITGKIPEDALDRLRSDGLVAPSQMGVAIPQSLETILMYGLAVFRENRCQSMDELSRLIEQAFAQQEVTVRKTADISDELYRTQIADGYYKSQVQSDFSSNYVPPQTPPVDYTRTTTTTGRGPNKKAVATVIAISAVVIVATVVLLAYVFLSRGSSTSATSSGSSSAAISSDDSDAILAVTVPQCVNDTLTGAQSSLESLGLVVATEYAYSDDVGADQVISQDIASGTAVDPGTTVTLTVSLGADTSPEYYDQKLTVTASSGSSSATATLYEWQDGDWQQLAQYSAIVGDNGIGESQEGTHTSPIGTHKLGVVLVHAGQSVSTNLSTYSVTTSTGVVSEPSSSYYNQILESAPAGVSKFDKLYDEFSYAAIYIEHNGSGFSSDGVVSGKGSAICVRGRDSFPKSGNRWGDVDISTSDMKDLLSRLDADKTPVIELKVS